MADGDITFIGSVKIQTTSFGDITKVGLNADDLEKLKENMDERGWVNIEFLSSKAGKAYGRIARPFTPSSEGSPKGAANATDQQDEDELPF